jgi:hypothetical protein
MGALMVAMMGSTVPLDLTDLMKNINAPVLTHLWQELEYHINVCRVTCGAHIELL